MDVAEVHARLPGVTHLISGSRPLLIQGVLFNGYPEPVRPPVALARAAMAPSRCVRSRLSKASVFHVVARVVGVLVMCTVVIWWVETAWWDGYVRSSPRTPIASTGQTTAVSHKDGTFFVERRWRDLNALLNPGVVVLGIVLMVSTLLIDRAAKRARHAEAQGAEANGDAYAVCPECLGQGPRSTRNVCPYCLGTGFADGKVRS
jgi:hypothetical protein